MNELLTCVLLIGSGLAVVAAWLFGRWLLCHEFRLEMLEEIEEIDRRRRDPPGSLYPPVLSIVRPDDGPDLAA